jgi:hypothetical protein
MIYKLDTQESEVRQARKLIEAPKKAGWRRWYWGLWVNAMVVALVGAILSSGCNYSLSQIRENEPYRTLTSTKSTQELAKCIELKIRAETGGEWPGQPPTTVVLEEHPNNVYRVALTFPNYTAVADILVKPSDSGAIVEYRRHHWWAGQNQLLEVIERCAK